MHIPFISAADAQIGAPPNVGLPSGSLPELLLQGVNYILVLVGVIALGYMVYGGFLYITAGGDEKQVDKGKRTLIYAIVGIVVIALAAAVVNFAVGAVLQGQ